MEEKDNLSMKKLENVFGGAKLGEGEMQVDFYNAVDSEYEGHKVKSITMFIPASIDVKGGAFFKDKDLRDSVVNAAWKPLKELLNTSCGVNKWSRSAESIVQSSAKAPDGMQAIIVRCHYCY